MFKIYFRIVDDIEELKSITRDYFDSEHGFITGFIKIHFGEHNEGCYYHENPLRKDEIGGELIDYWLEGLLDVLNNLHITKYSALKELETVNRWLEFKLNGENVLINVAIDKGQKTNKLFIPEPFNGFSYIEPTDYSIIYDEFKDEVLGAVSRFIKELEDINSELLKTKMALRILNKLKV